MTERRRGLGRGLGALIPAGPETGMNRPVDVFFPQYTGLGTATAVADGTEAHDRVPDSPASLVEPREISDGSESAPTSIEAADADGLAADGAADDQTALGEPRETPVPGEPSNDGFAQPREKSAPGSLDGRMDGTTGQESAPREDGLLPVPGAHFAEVVVEAIGPNPRQPRQVFDEEDLEQLVGSIREVGVLQPIVVRPSEDPDGAFQYELIMGERRWRAAQLAGLAAIPAIVRITPDGDMLRDALLENLHRVQLNPLEEAAAYQQLLEDFACTHDELANRVARSRPQISNTIRLLRLPPTVQRRVAAGVLSAGHARAILGLTDIGAQERLAQRVVAEGLSVRATEEVVALGEDRRRPAPRRRAPADDDGRLAEMAARLSDHLDTRVRINVGQRKGRIAIEFATVDDLDRILGVLTPAPGGGERFRTEEASGY